MWVKGNLHCHTTVSDADSAPEEVCRYYAEHGYSFLSITDHNTFVDPESVDSSGLLLIPGTELSLEPNEDPAVPLHVCGFGISGPVEPERTFGRAETLQNCIDSIIEAGGIAQINHPNFRDAFDDTTIAKTRGALLLEVYNGHPQSYNDADETHKAVEEMWDDLLTAGHMFYGTGVDDTHHFLGEFAPRRANPSRAWIWARVGELTVEEVLSALRRGDFYASTGVELEDVTLDGLELRVAVSPVEGLSYRTQFIGDGGRVLHESTDVASQYRLPADDSVTYMRAKVTASDGTRAWTQPVLR